MARRRADSRLDVYANGERVGDVTSRTGTGLEFRYATTWLGQAGAYPISLSLPLREEPYRDGVAAVLDNLLPDLSEVRTAIAARVGAKGTDPFSLLWELGRDCVGSLSFVPAGQEVPADTTMLAEPIADDEIGQLLRSLSHIPLGVSRANDGFRISVAGAQEKTSLLKIDGQWWRPLGTTPSSHIIKPALGKRGEVDLAQSVENEHLCMLLLAGLGLGTAKTAIESFGGVKALVVTRFDREWQKDRLLRRPQEDMCQALGVPTHAKYEDDGGPGVEAILRLLGQSDDSLADRKSFVQACYAFWLLGATDGHAKNFSVSLGAGGSFRLAPLYDVMSLQPQVSGNQLDRRQFKLAMAVGNRRRTRVDQILPRHFVQTAARAGVPEERVRGWLAEIDGRLPLAVERVGAAVAELVPAPLFEAVVNGAIARSKLNAEG